MKSEYFKSQSSVSNEKEAVIGQLLRALDWTADWPLSLYSRVCMYACIWCVHICMHAAISTWRVSHCYIHFLFVQYAYLHIAGTAVLPVEPLRRPRINLLGCCSLLPFEAKALRAVFDRSVPSLRPRRQPPRIFWVGIIGRSLKKGWTFGSFLRSSWPHFRWG